MRLKVVEFVGLLLVTVAEARAGVVVSRVTEFESTRVDVFVAASLIHTERTLAFSVAETEKLAGSVPGIHEQLPTVEIFS